jgi:poly-gamma-glutamate capsule biosynthesis protein CapA/YwtB (metallophosphatase superfamily)
MNKLTGCSCRSHMWRWHATLAIMALAVTSVAVDAVPPPPPQQAPPSTLAAPPQPQQQPPGGAAAGRNKTPYDTVATTETNVVDGFTLVAVGDAIVGRPIVKLQDPGFNAVLKILHNADVTFGNLEDNIFDVTTFTGAPQAEYGGAWHVGVPAIAQDLKAMGFNLMSRANNHSLDWGVEGMRETTKYLDQVGIVHAGTGENLAQAGAARFVETSRGRVSLVSFATTYSALARAAAPAGEAPGRPGLNALRLTRTAIVTRDMLDNLRKVRDGLPRAPRTPEQEKEEKADELSLLGTRYKVGDKPAFTFVPDERDVKEILRNVRNGKQFSDFCILTDHGHEPGNWSQEPPDFMQPFAHQAIDAGADAFIVHGPHQLRGIEIYKGRPIFYSIGNFIFDDKIYPVAADMYEIHKMDPRVQTDGDLNAALMARGFNDENLYQSIITVSRYEHNQLAEIRLYPIDLGYATRLADRGVPRLAAPPLAKTILERLQKLSQPYGTTISIEQNVGVIRLRQVSGDEKK